MTAESPEHTNDILRYMDEAAHSLQSEYERIRARSAEDPGTAGDNGEGNWAKLLREWLPQHYHVVTKGRIMNARGECGPQVDVIVLSPTYPPFLLDKKEYLQAGVIAAFECKLTLAASDVRKAVKNAALIAQITRRLDSTTPYQALFGPIRYGLLAHSHSWKGENAKPAENIEAALHDAQRELKVTPMGLLDYICVSNLSAWYVWKSLEPRGETIFHRLLRSAVTKGAEGKVLSRYSEFSNMPGWSVNAGHIRMSGEKNGERRRLTTPVGTFLEKLFVSLAYQQQDMRIMAEYMQVVHRTSGRGQTFDWIDDVIPEQISVELDRLYGGEKGHRQLASDRWSEWCIWY